jgi:DNA-binding MarR family transcriptional regulator
VRAKRSAIQEEIRQGKPFASRGQEAAIGLLRTADVLRRLLARVVEPNGITLQQYNVLRILRGAGEVGLPTLDIAARMIEQAPGITRLLDRLEAKRLVRRRRCTEDRRQVLCWIAPAGLALLSDLDAPMLAADETGLGRLPRPTLASLIRILDDVRSSISLEPSSSNKGDMNNA